MELPAPLGRAAIIADIMVERALPVLLELAARDEDHVGILEAGHIAAEIAAIPRRLHVGDDMADRRLLGRFVIGRRAAAGGEGEQSREAGAPHPRSRSCAARAIAMAV